MTITQLIDRLQALREEHGDLPVFCYDRCEELDAACPVKYEVSAYDQGTSLPPIGSGIVIL